MKENLNTRYVFLDTSIFIKENFFAGNKLNSFLKYAKDNTITLLTTDVTLNESLNNIKKKLIESFDVMYKYRQQLNSKGKILKNQEDYKSLFKHTEIGDLEETTHNLQNRFKKMISDNFTIISVNSEVTKKVFEDYFSENAPFKNGKKKSEFPDAFVLNSLVQYSKENYFLIYVVTEDPDMLGFISDKLLMVKEYDKLLDKISHLNREDKIFDKVETYIKDNEDEILSEIEAIFIKKFPYVGLDINYGYNYSVEKITVDNIFSRGAYVLYVKDNIASIELTINVLYSMKIEYEDTLNATYDRVNTVWKDYEVEIGEFKEENYINAEIDLELEGDEDKIKSWSLKQLNDMPEGVKIVL